MNQITRREMLRLLALSAGGAILAACSPVGAPIANATQPAPTKELETKGAPPLKIQSTSGDVPITPIKDFYSVSYGNDPFQVPSDWKLTIAGLVDKPLTLSLDDLKAMPSVTEMRTLQCISNPVGGDLIGNAVWKGVQFKTLLAMAGVQSNAHFIKLEAFDGWNTGIPLDLGMHDHALLVYEMNGESLPIEHGAPLRCLWTGRYGMKQPKWIKTITLVAENYRGFWEKQGWSNDAFIQPMSRIDSPADNALVPTQPVTLSGIAFSGEEGIAKVQIALNGGPDWQEVQLTRGPSPYVWTTWTWTGQDLSIGKQQFYVRTTTNSGKMQTLLERVSLFGDSFPNGTIAEHSIVLDLGK